MTVTFDSLIGGFPEFEAAPIALVEAKIAEAVLQIDAEVWGAKTDLGVSYLACHLLSMSSFGQHSRLQPANTKVGRTDALTTYEREYQRIKSSVASGFRVVG